MTELIHRSFSFDVRGVKDDERSVEVIASTDAIDAYGEVLVQDWNLKRYKANPVVLYNHYGLPIGRSTDTRVEDNKLHSRLHFVDERANPMAEQVWQGIVQGSLRAVSVGFRSKSAKSQVIGDKTVFVLSGNELVEISVVPVPANPEAVALGMKSLDIIRALAASGDSDMTILLKTILPILMLAETATEAEVASEVNRLKSAERELLLKTGKKSITEVLGSIEGWKSATDQLTTANTEIAALKKAGDDRDRDDLIRKGVAEKKLVPAQVEKLKNQPLDFVKSFLDVAQPNAVLARSVEVEPGDGGEMKWKGKSWKELSFSEQHELHEDNLALYEAMRDAAEKAA